MKRFHVHVAVNDITESVGFYSKVFGTEPTVLKPDYAKWMVDDPRINFAISARGARGTGVNHLGLQVDSDDELKGMRAQLAAADAAGWEPLARYVRIAITLEAGAVALDFSAVLAVTYLVPDAVERAADARREHVGLPIDEFSGVDDAFAVARARLDEDALAQSYDFVIRRERPGQPVDRRQVLRHRSPQRGGECGFVRIENAPLNLQRFAIAIARR